MGKMQDRGNDRGGQRGQQKDQQDGSFWQQLSTLGTDLFGSGSLSPTHSQQAPNGPLPAGREAAPKAGDGEQQNGLASGSTGPLEDAPPSSTSQVTHHAQQLQILSTYDLSF